MLDRNTALMVLYFAIPTLLLLAPEVWPGLKWASQEHPQPRRSRNHNSGSASRRLLQRGGLSVLLSAYFLCGGALLFQTLLLQLLPSSVSHRLWLPDLNQNRNYNHGEQRPQDESFAVTETLLDIDDAIRDTASPWIETLTNYRQMQQERRGRFRMLNLFRSRRSLRSRRYSVQLEAEMLALNGVNPMHQSGSAGSFAAYMDSTQSNDVSEQSVKVQTVLAEPTSTVDMNDPAIQRCIAADDAGKEDTFVFYRILGNDLPPRHSPDQTWRSVQFILANEPDFPRVEKRWVLNRIINATAKRNLMALLEEYEQPYHVISFEAPSFARVGINFGGAPASEWFTAKEGMKRYIQQQLLHDKIRFAMNNNGARNFALRDGRSRARWVFPWDGNCFLTEKAFAQIQVAVSRYSMAHYIMVPMVRMLSNTLLLDPDFEPGPHNGHEANEEPQVIFRCDAKEEFNENMRYGRMPKVELLKRLSHPGPWDHIKLHPWEPNQTLSRTGEKKASASYVCRLFSGNETLERDGEEVVKNPGRIGSARHAARLEAIVRFIDSADAVTFPFQAMPFRHENTNPFGYGTGVSLLAYDETLLEAERRALEPSGGRAMKPPIGPVQELLMTAERALQMQPLNVIDGPLPPSKNEHHYYSIAPPKQFSPEQARQAKENFAAAGGGPTVAPWTSLYTGGCNKWDGCWDDRSRFQAAMGNITALALSYMLTDNEAFATQAAKFVRTWFLDKATGMSPQLAWSYCRRVNRKTERMYPGGYVDTVSLVYALDAVKILIRSGYFPEKDVLRMHEWVAKFLEWLLDNEPTSVSVRSAKAHATEYFGTAWDLQVLACAAYLDFKKTFLRYAQLAPIRFMSGPPQAMPNPLEVALDTAQVQHWALRGDFEDSSAELNGVSSASSTDTYYHEEFWPSVSPETCYHLWLFAALVQVARQGGVDILKGQSAQGRGPTRTLGWLLEAAQKSFEVSRGRRNLQIPTEALVEESARLLHCPETSLPHLKVGLSVWSSATNAAMTIMAKDRAGAAVEAAMSAMGTNVRLSDDKESEVMTLEAISALENEQKKPVDCEVGPWGEWDDRFCGCGVGYLHRIRQVTIMQAHGGKPCPPLLDTTPCDQDLCDNVGQCVMGDWGPWEDCTVSCGGGTEHRRREVISRDEVADGTAQCPERVEQRQCKLQPCSIPCEVSTWSHWGHCSVDCNGGQQLRTRQILVSPAFGGEECPNLWEKRECNTHTCDNQCQDQVDAAEWSECSVDCGGGYQWREIGTGAGCSTMLRQEQPCNEDPCSINCEVAEWSDWSSCSEQCGGGTKYRIREVVVEAANDGLPCPPTYETAECNGAACAMDCVVSEWGEWSSCLQMSRPESTRCRNINHAQRLRTVGIEPEGGGRPCPSLVDIRACDEKGAACGLDEVAAAFKASPSSDARKHIGYDPTIYHGTSRRAMSSSETLQSNEQEQELREEENSNTTATGQQQQATCRLGELLVRARITFAKGDKGFAVKPVIANSCPAHHEKDVLLNGLVIPFYFSNYVKVQTFSSSFEWTQVPYSDFQAVCTSGKVHDNPERENFQRSGRTYKEENVCEFIAFESTTEGINMVFKGGTLSAGSALVGSMNEVLAVVRHRKQLPLKREGTRAGRPYCPTASPLPLPLIDLPKRREKLTAVITSFGTTMSSVLQTLQAYSESTDLIQDIYLVWNNDEYGPSPEIRALAKGSVNFHILRQKHVSPANRWFVPEDLIKTDAVLVVDDDIWLERSALRCMFEHWLNNKDRLVGPWVRSHLEDATIGAPLFTEESELGYSYYMHSNDTYSLLLPRAMLLHKAYMSTYSLKDPRVKQMRLYADHHEAKCDDILLNMLATTSSKRAPLRVSLPWNSVHGDDSNDGAAYPGHSQLSRIEQRSECLTRLAHFFPAFPLARTDDIAYCGDVE